MTEEAWTTSEVKSDVFALGKVKGWLEEWKGEMGKDHLTGLKQK